MTALGAARDMYVLRVNDRVLVDAALRRYVGVPEDRVLAASMALPSAI